MARKCSKHLPGFCACGVPAIKIKNREFICARCDRLEADGYHPENMQGQGSKQTQYHSTIGVPSWA